MLKRILALLAMLYAAACFAAVDVNKASAAELDGIKGIGPGISAKIIDERAKGAFKNWDDLITRVKGVGETNAAKFSAEGMTVGGASYKGAVAAPATAKKQETATAKTQEKPAAKAAEVKAEEKPADAKKSKKADTAAAKAKDAAPEEKPADSKKSKKGATAAAPAASAASAPKK